MTTNVSMALCKCHLSDNLGTLERLNVVHHANYKRTSNNAAPNKFVAQNKTIIFIKNALGHTKTIVIVFKILQLDSVQ